MDNEETAAVAEIAEVATITGPEELQEREPNRYIPGSRGGPGRAKALPGKMTQSAAMKRLGCTRSKLQRLVKEEKLEAPETDTEGHVWYQSDAIEELAEDEDEKEITGAALIKAASGIIKQQFDHHEAMMQREGALMGAFISATHQILQLQTEWSGKAMERANKLEVELDVAREAIQTALSMEQQREMVLAEAAHRQKRNDQILESVKPHIPTVLAMIGTKFGANPEVAVDPLVKELMSTITEDQAKALYASGILTQAQIGQLLGVWEVMKKAAPAPPEGAS